MVRRSYRGIGNPNWNGGRFLSKDNYIYIYSPNHPHKTHKGYVAEHRLVMEKKLGRYLKSGEIVHHKNKITTDNRIKNLQLMKWGEHTKHHTYVDGRSLNWNLYRKDKY